MLKGMMLAAGRGTRLGYLTDNLPKPLLPVANRPVMTRGIECLRQLGIADIYINVSYRGQQIIDLYDDGAEHDVALHWSVEPEPLGTAGGLKRLERYLGDDQVIIIAGDAMLDIDLAPLLQAHRASGAFASLATIPVQDPSQYGVVVTDAQNRIVQFQEKPAPGTEISRQANTGIYLFEPGIFELIPAHTFVDFALNVFPEIMRRELPFYAFPVEGYWTDVGNPGDYLQANIDYLAGRIRANCAGMLIDNNLIAHDAIVAGSRLTNCTVGAGAVLARGCDLQNCVIWDGTVINEPMTLESAIFTPWGTYEIIGKEARLLEFPAVGVA